MGRYRYDWEDWFNPYDEFFLDTDEEEDFCEAVANGRFVYCDEYFCQHPRPKNLEKIESMLGTRVSALDHWREVIEAIPVAQQTEKDALARGHSTQDALEAARKSVAHFNCAKTYVVVDDSVTFDASKAIRRGAYTTYTGLAGLTTEAQVCSYDCLSKVW